MAKEAIKQIDEGKENPSMEEILESIRGVINDDMDETPNASSKTQETTEEDVFELTDVVEEDNIELARAEMPEEIKNNPEEKILPSEELADESGDEDHLVLQEPQNISVAPVTSVKEDIAAQEDQEETGEPIISEISNNLDTQIDMSAEFTSSLTKKNNLGLISEEAASKATDAMRDLVHKTLKPNSDGLKFRSGTTVEEIVIETMKPYLTQWLDDNLPSIVKNLVQKEIQKLVPREE